MGCAVVGACSYVWLVWGWEFLLVCWFCLILLFGGFVCCYSWVAWCWGLWANLLIWFGVLGLSSDMNLFDVPSVMVHLVCGSFFLDCFFWWLGGVLCFGLLCLLYGERLFWFCGLFCLFWVWWVWLLLCFCCSFVLIWYGWLCFCLLCLVFVFGLSWGGFCGFLCMVVFFGCSLGEG